MRKFGSHRAGRSLTFAASIVLAAAAPIATAQAPAWEPTKPVEFVVPAGTGGGADQMARLLQGVISKNNLMKQPLVVVNKSGGAGAEGFLAVKEAKGDPHKIIITLSNLFTTPLATGVPFNWKDLTPVSMLALDQFVLWVNADTPYKTAKDYLAAAKGSAARTSSRWAAPARSRRTRSSPSRSRRRPASSSPTCRSRAAATSRCNWSASTSTRRVNNPIEAVAQWRAGKLRPLCVFDDQRMPYKTKVTETMSWNDIPTCKEAGVPTDYVMLRGIFMPGGVTKEQVDYYVDVFKKVRETPEWKKFMEDGAFNTTFMSGAEYAKWVEKAEGMHRDLMKEAGFLAK